MTTTTAIIEMLKNIDSHAERTMQKASLSYDVATLNEIIKKEYVSVIGNKVTRKFHAKNYEQYA